MEAFGMEKERKTLDLPTHIKVEWSFHLNGIYSYFFLDITACHFLNSLRLYVSINFLLNEKREYHEGGIILNFVQTGFV